MFEDLIIEKGERHETEGNYLIFLREKEGLWFLKKGSVTLFSVERKKGKPEGQRTFLTSLSAPAVLFAMPIPADFSHEIVAITEEKTLFWKGSFHFFQQSAEVFYVEKWINSLALFYRKELLTETQNHIEAPQTITLSPEETLSLKRAVTHAEKSKLNWIEITEGEMEFLGYSSLTLFKGPFPLTYNAWLKCRKQAVVTATTWTPQWQQGLNSFHEKIFNYFLVRKQTEEKEEKKRSELRLQKERDQIHETLLEMASVLNPIKSSQIGYEKEAKALLAACRLLDSYLKVTFRLPEDTAENEDLSTLIAKIAEASEVRYRQVRLLGKWWKKDSGPLLAFYGKNFTPVALVPKHTNSYEIINPEEARHTKVNEKTAKDLSRIAYTFYPPFPDTLKTGKELLHFYLKQNKKEFTPLIFYSFLAAAISLFPPFATEILMNKLIPQANVALVWQLALALLIGAFSASIFLFFRSLMIVRLEGRSSNQIQSALWDRILKLPVSFFRRYSTGNLIMRVLSTEWMRTLLSGNATRILFSGLFSFFYLFAMVLYAPALTLITVGIFIASLLITFTCAFFYARMQKEFYDLEGKINTFLIQIISSVGKLRTTGSENNAFSKWGHQFAKYKKVELRSQSVKNIVKVVNYVLPFLLYIAIFGFIIGGETYSLGAYLAFNLAFVNFYLAMIDLSNTLLEITPMIPLWDKAKLIVQEPLEEQLKKEKPGRLRGEIHVDGVYFHYEDSDKSILQNINLKVNPKEFIGIVGPSGSGKSTLIRLLLGFERPKSGAIYYDDQDLATLSLQDFRKQLGVVLQDEGIIAGSLYDNLTCGGIYKPEDLERALEVSGFAEDIASFPMGLHTYLSMGGTTLSGGQKQRLLIARALLPNPKILFLDEATSALDNRNQDKVIKSINQLDVTRIVIAHRLSTIKNADRIYVMDKGEFVQMGTFVELASQSGPFAAMLRRQSL